jgi:hypothetical protein
MFELIQHLFALVHMDRLTVFGLIAVSLMLIFYALEKRSSLFVLAFALACVLGSTYGFLQGAWPFGLVEGVWSLVALRRWWAMRYRREPASADVRNVADFLEELSTIAPPAGRGSYAFTKLEGSAHGFVQFIIESPRRLTIHRIWTHEPAQGSGSLMLRQLCDLADRHQVDLELKVIPLGRKPYPMSREQLTNWYQQYGFEGTHKKMTRKPRDLESASVARVA